MAAGDPKQPPAYRLGELEPHRFEGLVFRLAWIHDARVVRLRAPDGGLDTLLPDDARPGKAERGWQAKRHPRQIDWDDCESSLDRAVDVWAVRHVTFVFPKDLSKTEHETFHRRLVSRHPDIHVDYWAASAVIARLDSAEGRRVAAFYFQEDDAVTIAERMLRAGSPLQSGEDFLSAESAIADALAEANPDYDWRIYRATRDSPEPAQSPGALLRLSFGKGDIVLHADLVPRHGSPDAVPGVTVQLDDTPEGARAREWLDQLRHSGGRLDLDEGVAVSVSDIPAPFGDLLGEPMAGELRLRVVPQPAPFYARLTAGAAANRVSLDIDLLPTEPSDEWDAALEGRVGGLVVTLRFRWEVHRGRGEVPLTFTYSGEAGAPHETESRVLRWLLATYESEAVTIEDRRGERPTIEHPIPAKPIPSWLPVWAQLHTDLADLERAAGRPAPTAPDEATAEAVHAINIVARMVRARHSPGTLTEVNMDFKPQATTTLEGVVDGVELRQTLVANVFGTEMPVARQVTALPHMIVRERVPLPDGGWRVTLVPLGGEQAEVMQELIPLSENPH